MSIKASRTDDKLCDSGKCKKCKEALLSSSSGTNGSEIPGQRACAVPRQSKGNLEAANNLHHILPSQAEREHAAPEDDPQLDTSEVPL
jgi:hypothetical protein